MKHLAALILLVAACGVDSTNAHDFAARHFPGYSDLECMRFDSDDDGYVSCTLQDANGTPQAIECSTTLSCNDGCRLARIGR